MRHSHPLCARCHDRWPQAKHGLCRRCERTLGLDVPSNFDRDAEVMARRRRRLPAIRIEPPPPRPPRTRIVKGQEFEIVWDGAVK